MRRGSKGFTAGAALVGVAAACRLAVAGPVARGAWDGDEAGAATVAARGDPSRGMTAGVVAQAPRLVVLDLPYEQVWQATLRALAGYAIERAAAGVVVLAPVERGPRDEEAGVTRVTERITIRLDAFGPGSTRIAVEVVAQGLRDGMWTAVPSTETTAREILAKIRAAQG